MPYIAELLDDAGIQVLIYNGDRDMSTCSQGNEVLLDDMAWSGASDWKDPHVTRRGLWVVDDRPAGYSKPLKNLNFVVVYNSGHLVPYNQPKVALDLVTRYLNGTSFVDQELAIFAPLADAWKHKQQITTMEASQQPWNHERDHGGLLSHLHLVPLILGMFNGVAGTVVYNRKHHHGRRYHYESVEEVVI